MPRCTRLKCLLHNITSPLTSPRLFSCLNFRINYPSVNPRKHWDFKKTLQKMKKSLKKVW